MNEATGLIVLSPNLVGTN